MLYLCAQCDTVEKQKIYDIGLANIIIKMI